MTVGAALAGEVSRSIVPGRLPARAQGRQLVRISHRQASALDQTFPMTETEADRWRDMFQAPHTAELDGTDIACLPAEWPGWPEWAADRWPSLADG